MNSYPFDKKHRPGTWNYLRTVYHGLKATFNCPMCGQYGSLEDHEISDDGVVTPSVVCPNDTCTFHEYIQLEGWQRE